MANTEVMTVHKALAELKVLDKRINDAINGCTLIGTKKNNQDKIRGKSKDQFNVDVKADYDKICDLIRRRNAIKEAVTLSNSVTKVTIAEHEYTVVEAIDKKNHGMQYYQYLYQVAAMQLAEAKRNLEKYNDSLQQKAEAFVSGLNAGGEVKKGSEEYTSTLNTYIKTNTMELIDPLNLEKILAELDEMINAFLPEVDAALSTSNALTTITITY